MARTRPSHLHKNQDLTSRLVSACYTNYFLNPMMMKVILSFLAVGSLASAQDLFFKGQAARLVIGQPTFTAQRSGPDSTVPGQTGERILGAATGLAYANGMLFVADSNRFGAAPLNHRVLIYRNLSTQIPPANVEFPVDDLKRCPACVGEAATVLGQDDFTKNDLTLLPKQNTLRLPTAVASDGQKLIVADTDNNRVLIWNSIPTSNKAPADVVLGQADFTKSLAIRPPNNKSLLGPQGVWIQAGKLYVADTQNHRILVWNSIPTSNNPAADIVLGQKDFNTAVELDLVKSTVDPQQNNLLNPVSVTSDGIRLFVSDLGFNRVLIWNKIPTQNTTPADVVVGQPDFTSAVANNVEKLCDSNGKDATTGALTYPAICSRTMEYPRFALSDGKRLYIADGGNDRVLVFNTIPTTNAPKPDIILGQLDDGINRVSESAYPLLTASSDQLRTPSSLAWDGANLYVSDPFNRRILVYSLADRGLEYNAVRNSASIDVFAQATISFGGTVRENDEVTATIAGKDYKYKIKKDDKVENIVVGLTNAINGGNGDPNVLARPFPNAGIIRMSALKGGLDGNAITLATSTSPADATITLTTSGANLNGGQDAAKVAPGTLITIKGEGLSDSTAAASDITKELPRELAGVQVYFDGFRAPLIFVSPTQINAQLPFEVSDATSVSAWVRTKRASGKIEVTSAVAVPIVAQNPGIFADGGPDPRPGVVLHYSSKATGTVSVDGSVKVGDTATIQIGPDDANKTYSYTVKEGNTLASIRDNLINVINGDPDAKVVATGAGVFTRIRLTAKTEGADGNGLVYKTVTNSDAQVILTATTAALCCANVAGSRVTVANPALPGETIVIYTTGLGLIYSLGASSDADRIPAPTGKPFTGELYNQPQPSTSFVSSLAGGKTAQVLYAGLKQGSIGIYEVHLELNSDLPTDETTELTIAQDVYVSNVITFPVKNPNN